MGYGHLYQDRYKSFIVKDDKHFLDLVRYVEQNPLRAKLVKHSEEWRWGGLYRREKGKPNERKIFTEFPTELPKNYMESVNQLLNENILEELRFCAGKGKPYGNRVWVDEVIKQFGLEYTIRPPGRPAKNIITPHF